MTNGMKILIGVAATAVVVTGIVVGVNESKKKIENVKADNKSIIDEYLNEENETQNTSENEIENTINSTNEISQNETINNTVNNSTTTTSSTTQTTGKEEQQSQTESTNNEETAIELAKKEWGIDVDSYSFEAKQTSDGVYTVTVRSNDSNRTTVAIYTVNVKTGTVTE